MACAAGGHGPENAASMRRDNAGRACDAVAASACTGGVTGLGQLTGAHGSIVTLQAVVVAAWGEQQHTHAPRPPQGLLHRLPAVAGATMAVAAASCSEAVTCT